MVLTTDRKANQEEEVPSVTHRLLTLINYLRTTTPILFSLLHLINKKTIMSKQFLQIVLIAQTILSCLAVMSVNVHPKQEVCFAFKTPGEEAARIR